MILLGSWDSETKTTSINQSKMFWVESLRNVSDFAADLKLQTLEIVTFSYPPFVDIERQNDADSNVRKRLFF